MEERALRGLYDHSSPSEHRATLQYFEQLKSSLDGWKLCATDFTQRIHSDDRVKFFCLQVLESHVKTKHSCSSDDDILALRKVLLTWLQPNEQGSDKVFVKNKMSQIFALVFVTDYPMKWPHFFTDMLQSIQSAHPWTVDLYLRILLAIDSEVVDRQVIHTQEENARNVIIKDHMRDHCVPDLVESWLWIMSVFEQVDHGVVCLAMAVIGAYVSWIDISLITSDKCMSYLLKYLSVATLRESAADCLHEVVSKGMDPMAKTELVDSLFKVLVSAGILNTGPSDDVDFLVKLSKMVNGMGCALVSSWSKLIKGGEEEKSKVIFLAVEAMLPFLHRYLRDEDDGVSEAVIDFAVQYVGILKQRLNLSDNDRTNLQALLGAIIDKLKYDESYNFSEEGEEEVLFLEYRKQLKVLLDNIALLDSDLVLQTSQSVLSAVLSNLEHEPFMNVEVVLRVFYMLGEVITSKKCGSSNVSVPGSPWHQMMTAVVQSQVGRYEHTAVLLQYFETVVRYEKFFSVESQYVLVVLEQFLGEQGLRHSNGTVRSRLSYLFVRFIKAVKNQVSPVAEQVLDNLRPLLLMFPGGSQDCGGVFSSNDFFFLYESAGILVASVQQTPEHRKALMDTVLTPVLERYPLLLENLSKAGDPAIQEQIGQALYGLLSCASRTSKVFTNHQQLKQSGCLECYTKPLPVFLRGLEVVVQRELLHSGVRQYIHRMIICLGDELLNYVPMAISLLLKDCTSRDLQDFIPLINQLITKYKDRILSMLQEIFMPVCQTMIHHFSQPCAPNDLEEQRDQLSLQKSYFLFISSIVTNNVSAVIAHQGSQNIEEILCTIVQGARSFPDSSVQKICFGILRRLIEVWGSGEGLPGFVEYSYKHILPTCFIAPLKCTFDFNDGHSFMALGEISTLLKTLLDRRGTEMLIYLQSDCLPSLNISPETAKELIKNMQQLETKSFKVYLKELFLQMRTLSQTLQ